LQLHVRWGEDGVDIRVGERKIVRGGALVYILGGYNEIEK
jgi:hypothetical protein